MPSPTFAHSSSLVGWLTNEASHGASRPFIANTHADDSPVRHCSSVRSNRNRVGFLPAAIFRCHFDAVPVRSRRDRWYAGTGPGVLAIVLSVLSLNYFFLDSFFSFSSISYADLVYLTFCTFCALAVGWVSAVRRRTEQELRLAHEELDAKISPF